MKTGRTSQRLAQNAKSKTQNVLRQGLAWGRFALLAFVLVPGLQAADVQISAGLDRSEIALNDQVRLSVTIAGGGSNLPSPQMPALPDFQVANAGRAQNFSWINGQASASITYNFILTPLKEGTFTIPPVRIQSNGQTLESAALTLHVAKGDAAAIPSPQEDEAPARAAAPRNSGGSNAIFIRGSVDKSSVFVGEPVIYTFRLYNRVALYSRPNYQPPEMTGFWSEDLPPQRTYTATVDGLPYNVTELRTALFPTSAGTARISPAQLAVTIENLGSDPFSQDFFAQFFGRAEQRVLRTEALTVHVKPLPEPKPAGFAGAVGRYTMSANLDKDTVSVGQPVTLNITVSGEGNIKSLPNVELPPVTNFRTYDAKAATSIEKNSGKVRGSKVYSTVLIPTASGDLTIPSVPFVYFDPEAKAYKTLHSKTFMLHARPGAAGSEPSAATPNAGPGPAASSAAQIQRLAEDIRYIKTPARLPEQSPPWVFTAWYRWLHIVLGILMLLAGAIRGYQKVFLANSAWNRFKNAATRAQSDLKKAEALTAKSEVKQAVDVLADTLHVYVADKLSVAPSGLALKAAMEQLRDKGMHPHDTEKVRNLWEMFDLFEFAPTQVRPEDLRGAIETFRHVIEETEKSLQWKK